VRFFTGLGPVLSWATFLRERLKKPERGRYTVEVETRQEAIEKAAELRALGFDITITGRTACRSMKRPTEATWRIR
jgi:hypothetical protein